jgi:hypothetical protein
LTEHSGLVGKDSSPIPILLNPLDATLMDSLVSVVNKGLTERLNPLDATLTKNREVGGVMVN